MSSLTPKSIADWEKRLSEFLLEAILHPEKEVEICERLIAYVQNLVNTDASAYKQRCLRTLLNVYGRSPRQEPLKLVKGGENV